MTVLLSVEALCKRYGPVVAVDDFSLAVSGGELIALLGPSGCGKTTALRMIAGLTPATCGRVLVGGKDVTRLPAYRRNIGIVFQGYALFPHLTVAENVAFGLEMRAVPRPELTRRVGEVLARVRLERLAERYPRQLSGGQQQRVAIARALVINPDILLLDEPMSSLDIALRHDVGLELQALQRQVGVPTILVTHDQREALALATRLVVMSEGRIRQVGTP
ncbi:MAG TPA: ABC transporter ATP-binding protein, partial [Beijerinckiaceae bacterium]|nr:ABC transporter ATP-binding protein [Beijerinckiaceae bacterium]